MTEFPHFGCASHPEHESHEPAHSSHSIEHAALMGPHAISVDAYREFLSNSHVMNDGSVRYAKFAFP